MPRDQPRGNRAAHLVGVIGGMQHTGWMDKGAVLLGEYIQHMSREGSCDDLFVNQFSWLLQAV